jgi:hypothetical protein
LFSRGSAIRVGFNTLAGVEKGGMGHYYYKLERK